MTFIELFVPKGALSEQARHQLGERLVTELIRADGAPADIIARGRALSWLVIHEPDTWTIGGHTVTQTSAPPYLVRVSVPGGHLNDSMRAEVVARVTQVLAEIDTDPQRLYHEPDAWIQIVELPDGNMGAFGQIVRLADIVNLVVEPDYKMDLVGTRAEEPSPETVVDPICGMTVALTDTSITLVHNGITYGFCNIECRNIFVAQQRATRSGEKE